MYSTLEHFLKYVTYDTQSKEDAGVVPSTPGQMVLAKEMEKELRDRGLKDITLTDHAYVTATLPSNSKKKLPAIGFIAHMDTATEASGKDVKARVVKGYDGGDVVLNEKLNVVLAHRPERFAIYAQTQADVMLSGHAHGGQIRFGHRGVYAPQQGFFPKYTEGWYRIGNSSMYVSRGLGNTIAFPRVFNTPELNVIDFLPVQSKED